MDRFAQWVIKYRLLVVAIVAVLTILGGLFITKFSYIESDITKYLPEDDPVVIRFREAGDRFGGVATAMVGYEAEDIFTPEELKRVDRLTRAFKEIEGVSWVISLTSIDDVQETVVEGEKAVQIGKVIKPGEIPENPAEIQKLKKYVLGKENLVSTVVSADGKLANIIINIVGEDRVKVATEIEKRAREMVSGDRLFFTGFPYWMKVMAEMILRDMAVLVPIVTLIVMLILFLSFRSLRGVVLPLATVIISSVWAMGLMAAVDIPITILSNAVPVLLIALGTAYAIHLLHKYNEVVCEEGAGTDNIRSSMVDVMVPICLAGLTTMIGFLSFLTSDLVFIQHTGIIAAFGIFSAMIIALTFLPAILSWLKPRKTTFDYSGKTLAGLARVADSTGRAVIKQRRPLLLVSLVIAAASVVFIPSLDRRFDMVSYFPEDSDVRRGDKMMREKLGGNTPVWVTAAGDVKHPYVLKSMLLIGKYLRSVENVDHASSVASIIAEMNDVLFDHFTVPDTPQGVGNLWFNLQGKDVLEQFVDKENKNALIQAMCDTADTAALRKVTRQIDDFLAQLPTKVIPTDLKTADKNLAKKAVAARLDRVALLVKLDVAYRLDRNIEHRQVLDWIHAALKQQPDRAEPWVYNRLFSAFVLCEESDLEFPSLDLAGKVTDVTSKAIALENADEERIQELIVSVLPADLLKEDPEAPQYLAKSLVALAREEDERRKVSHVLNYLLKQLGPDALQDHHLYDDLKGDLAELAESIAFLPVDEPGEGVVEAEFHQTGIHHISVNVDNRIVRSQLSSLALAVILATILIMLQFRSILAGLLGMVPMCLTLLINFGVMGAFHIHLEPGTVLIASMVVGVGIDYTIHFMSRTRLELVRQGKPASALDVSLKTAGRAILINAVTVMGGQLVFLAGDMQPLQIFGVLLAVAMVVSAVSAVTVLPALLMVVQPKFLRRPRD
jgi:predicted RND superfamily exporter protein